MESPIRFYFDFASPYAWFALDAAEKLAADHGTRSRVEAHAGLGDPQSARRPVPDGYSAETALFPCRHGAFRSLLRRGVSTPCQAPDLDAHRCANLLLAGRT